MLRNVLKSSVGASLMRSSRNVVPTTQRSLVSRTFTSNTMPLFPADGEQRPHAPPTSRVMCWDNKDGERVTYIMGEEVAVPFLEFTIEWVISSPPDFHTFDETPVVVDSYMPEEADYKELYNAVPDADKAKWLEDTIKTEKLTNEMAVALKYYVGAPGAVASKEQGLERWMEKTGTTEQHFVDRQKYLDDNSVYEVEDMIPAGKSSYYNN